MQTAPAIKASGHSAFQPEHGSSEIFHALHEIERRRAIAEVVRTDRYSAPEPPGQVLKRKLIVELGLTQAQLARALGVSEPRLTMIFKGRCALSAEIALRVERVFGITPHFWMRVRDEYELYQERQRLCTTLAALPSMADRKERTATAWLMDELEVAA